MAIRYATSNALGWGGDATTYSGAAQARVSGYTSTEIALVAEAGGTHTVNVPALASNANNYFWVHFRAVFPSDGSSVDGEFVRFLDTNGDFLGRLLFVNGDLQAECGDAGGGGATWSYTPGTAYTLDIRVESDGSGTEVQLYVDGNLVSVGTDTTRPEGNPVQAQFTMSDATQTGTATLYLAEFLIDDADPTLDKRLNELVPVSNGSLTAQTGTYTDLTGIADGNSVEGYTVGDMFSWNPSFYGGPDTGEGVVAVVVQTHAITASTGPTGYTPFVRVAGTNYFGSGVSVGVSNSGTGEYVWSLNPADTAAWDIADLTFETGFRADA